MPDERKTKIQLSTMQIGIEDTDVNKPCGHNYWQLREGPLGGLCDTGKQIDYVHM